ncbi:PIN domain-containing protein [Streptomyces sp. NPDC001889]
MQTAAAGTGNIVVDTQIVSYAMKDPHRPLPDNAVIPSTVAQELFLMQDQHSGRPRFFLPALGKHSLLRGLNGHWDRPTNRPLFKQSADRIMMDFAGDFDPVLERSHLGVSSVLAQRERDTFRLATRHLPKHDRDVLLRRFDFLLQHPLDLRPLHDTHITSALELLSRLTRSGGNTKHQFRNTLNDMLILAVALTEGALLTQDKELARVAGDYFTDTGQNGDTYLLEQPRAEQKDRKPLRESKGYVNRGWSYSLRK